jgi:hypothetical protein
LTASASSDLPVAFRIISGPGQVHENWAVPGGSGLVTVRAFQEGNDLYLPAAPVDRTFMAAVPANTVWSADVQEMQFSNVANRPSRIHAIAFQPDGRMIVGGDFSHVKGVPRSNLARFHVNGALDLAWNPKADGVVTAMVVHGDHVFVGGKFQIYSKGLVPHSKRAYDGGDYIGSLNKY